jgi:hypothetical protein
MRLLCSDGACVGVIGSDGTCKVCGRVAPNWGDERNRGLVTDDHDHDEDEDLEDDDEDDDEVDDEVEDRGPLGPGDEGWEDRKLCPDDSCIGVIGDDFACKVCGRRAE